MTSTTPGDASCDQHWPQARKSEGKAQFSVGDAFFRESSQTGRDLAILCAIAHRQSPTNPDGHLRILDAMTGCGVRPLRYLLEAEADYVWANEGNWDLHDCLAANLSESLAPHRYRITHLDANELFFDCYQRRDFYDLIDIDGFGSPMPTLSSSLWAVKLGGLLYLTSTDGRTTSGRTPGSSVKAYGAYARSHSAVHEQGLRLLLGVAVQQAAARGLSAQPVFSWHHGEVNRVMVRIARGAAWNSEHYGFLSYCHFCGQYGTLAWKMLGKGASCTCNPRWAPAVSGPMWLGPLHSDADLKSMVQVAVRLQAQAQHPDAGRRWDRAQKLLALMASEATQPPYYYPLAEIGRRGQMDIPPINDLLDALQSHGFTATRTHLHPQAIKTTAPIATCIELAEELNRL